MRSALLSQVRCHGFLTPLAAKGACNAFPTWLHLKAYAPHVKRMDTTDRIAKAISKSGGYLTHSTLLSDMATTIVLEDIDPLHIESFVDAIQDIDGLVIENFSKEWLDDCILRVREINEATQEKQRHITNFQQALHEMERDGLIDEKNDEDKKFVQQCHEFAQALVQKNAAIGTAEHNATLLPPTICATLQLKWTNAPRKTAHKRNEEANLNILC